MPSGPLHYCGPTCNELVPSGKKCKAHSRDGWRQGAQRLRGSRLQKERQKLSTAEPYCRHCKMLLMEHGPDKWIRDHIVPLAEGGAESPENAQPLCRPCSDAKTKEEAKRGVRRSR